MRARGKFEEIDKKEDKRISDLWDSFHSDEEIADADVFDNETIPMILKEKPLAFWDSFRVANPRLPLNCLLFPRTLVQICPGCDCSDEPELLKPYLEKELILPLLTHDLAQYPREFSELIIQYPYVGVQSYSFFVSSKFIEEGSVLLCEHCFDERCDKISKILSETCRDEETASSLKDVLFPHLSLACREELQILKEVKDAVVQKNLELLDPLFHKASLLSALRSAQAFKAIPQVDHDDLTNIANTLGKLEVFIDQEIIQEVVEKEWVIQALNLDYNPKLSIEDYLDIIIPRRKKINSLVNDLISSGKREQIAKINDEIWQINRELVSSETLESLTFLTNFVFDNSKILFSMFAGALIGYHAASFAGCGLGGLGGLAGGILEKLTKHKPFKIAEYPRKTTEWIKTKLEGPEEKLLSILLSKDIKVIQLWALTQKLKKEKT